MSDDSHDDASHPSIDIITRRPVGARGCIVVRANEEEAAGSSSIILYNSHYYAYYYYDKNTCKIGGTTNKRKLRTHAQHRHKVTK
jgi:hypothetical protein